ncbi:MAG: hypothetical protein ABSH19_00235 [Opitutales bacterium]|jgi:hypothetical protein
MTQRAEYGTVNEAAISQALDRLASEPAVPRPSRVDAELRPLADKLLRLHATGKSYKKLAEGLAQAGYKIPVSTLRDHMAKWRKERKKRRPVKR